MNDVAAAGFAIAALPCNLAFGFRADLRDGAPYDIVIIRFTVRFVLRTAGLAATGSIARLGVASPRSKSKCNRT